MLNSKGFDEWAAGYDASVRHSHDAGEYPFAGYDAVLSLIEARVNSRPGADVLDLGFGTGMLTARLYAAGHPVAGVDFSQNMLDAARAKMPCAELYLYDFTRGLPPRWRAGCSILSSAPMLSTMCRTPGNPRSCWNCPAVSAPAANV
ncbi:class I SAM-dependent DNA methyltransferase [Ruthenibacterium lactatiformans]|uniref:class I SAM-dependent DNA methyltransferase n=1 Tax=Ruthenibacterium lactatiformans TaxID=1550024 RepID=UPI001967C0A9|nr:methyltransferase domain-containing protein [Ruthenibacterium lactatiformans]MBN3028456.1 methyltransferase domain-containing protein [Ruthenibacterium lactatiformans]